MKAKFIVMSLIFTLTAVLFIVGSPVDPPKVLDQNKINAGRITPVICLKPDLKIWQGIGHCGQEFAFSYQCSNELEKAGIHKSPPCWSVWVENGGKTASPACKAKLTFKSGVYPHNVLTFLADIPALAPGGRHFLQFSIGAGYYILLSDTVEITLDSTNIVDECSETNNKATWRYR
jgi:hypothetical protein